MCKLSRITVTLFSKRSIKAATTVMNVTSFFLQVTVTGYYFYTKLPLFIISEKTE